MASKSTETSETLAIVRQYHDGWSTKVFSAAAAALDENVQIEVPVNEYPTKESFMAAVTAFGGMTTRVTLLDEFADGNRAMLVYDMEVTGLGTLCVAEHFTVANGVITRVRQVHDTYALRVAGFVQ